METIKYAKLRGRMTEKGVTQAMMAARLGISVQAMSKKLRGLSGFSQEDIIKICNLLDIAIDQIGLFFYAQKVLEM